MFATWNGRTLGALAIVLVAGIVIGMALNGPVLGGNAQADKGGVVCPRYTVVHTEGTNLIVTDNQSNTLYYYTIEEDGKPGDELILRGTGDLSQVGKPVIKPTLVNPKKKN